MKGVSMEGKREVYIKPAAEVIAISAGVVLQATSWTSGNSSNDNDPKIYNNNPGYYDYGYGDSDSDE